MKQLPLPFPPDPNEVVTLDVPEYAPDLNFGPMELKGDTYQFKMRWKWTGRFMRYRVPRSKLEALRAELALYLGSR